MAEAMNLEHSIIVNTPYTAAVARTREALAEQGFGVLSEIDVQATLREKRGAEMEPYVILAPATRTWPTGRWTSTAASGCCCRATWW